MRLNLSARLREILAVLLSLATVPAAAIAQETGTVTGAVTRAADAAALSSVSVSVPSIGLSTITGTDGRYTLRRVPVGQQTIVFRWLGYRPTEVPVVVEAGKTVTADAALEAVVLSLGEIVVEGASRGPERITEAPSAISVVPQEVLQSVAATGQAPMALQSVPGVDIVQSGVNDFNVNARGFNSSLNRRVLTLQDGRDLVDRLPRLAGMERHDPGARRSGQGGDGAGPGIGALRRQRLQRGDQHHDPGSARGAGQQAGDRGRRAGDLPGRWAARRPRRRRPDRLPAQRRVQPERHVFPLPDAAERHLAAGGVRGRDRRAGARPPSKRSRCTARPRTRSPARCRATATRFATSTAAAGWTTTSTTARCCRSMAAPPRWRTRSSSPASAGCRSARRSSPTPARRSPATGTTSSATGTAAPRSSRSSR